MSASATVVPAQRVPVLCYHSVTTEATERYRGFAIDPGLFREQMAAVAESGRRTVTVGDLAGTLAKGAKLPTEPTVVLTFDDGFRETHGLVLPVLDGLGLKATAYLVSAYIDGTSRWLTPDGEGDRPLVSWTEAREHAEHGIEIGSHGHRHLALDLLRDADARDEIVRSRQVLEDGLGRPVTSFAYPYGYHTGPIKRTVREAGYANACGIKQAISHPDDDPFAMSRIIVYADTRPEAFRDWLAGEGLPLGWRNERLVTRGWRTVRRFRARLGGGDVASPSSEVAGT
jgi:peptidoglycan/xylan/chitin deacetylase (PgdA/CDA1 family)